MGKITPGFKTILVFLTFLGFTNFILSYTNINLSEIVLHNVSGDKVVYSDNLSSADSAPVSREVKKTTATTVDSRSSEAAFLAPDVTVQTITPSSCLEMNDGGITISVIDAGNMSFVWSSDEGFTETTQNISNIPSGTYQVIVTDVNEESTTISGIEVPVEDNLDPVAITQNITVQLDSSGSATIPTDQIDNGSNDACGIASRVLDITSFDCTNIGANTVTLTVTDNNGNTSTATATVTVEDKVDPVVITQNITVQLDSNGSATITADQIDNGSNDACGIAGMDLDITSFDCSNVGANTVTLTVTDNNGNTSTATATVTVEDKVDPVAITQNITVQLDASGSATITPAQINNGSNDACGIADVVLDITSFDCSNIGANTVTLTVTDNNGNTGSSTATVTVEDNLDPVVITQNITVQLDATGSATITAGQIDNGSNDACGIAGMDLDITSFDCSNVGANTVTLTVTDNNGNTSTDTANVTLQDTEVPVITPGADITRNNDAGSCYTTIDITYPTTADNCNVGAAIGTRSDGLALIEQFPVGTTTITWTVTDDNNNSAVPVTQLVTVVDNEVPALPEIENITWGCSYTVTPPVTTDNCTENITGTTSSPLTYASAGTYTINWQFTDEHNNTSSINQTITIAPLQAQAQITNVLCNGFSTGVVTINASGGTAPYTYNWNTLGTGQTKSNLSAGTYFVTISDVNGCETSPMEVIITEPTAISMTEPAVEPISCFGANDGTITIGDVSGGAGNYSYMITGKAYQSSKTFSNLTPGTYTITVKDGNNCILEEDIVLNEPTELSMAENLSISSVSCFGASDGAVTAGTVTGGNGNYLYSIDNVTFTSEKNFTGLSTGTHTIFVKDSKNCALQSSVNIPGPAVLNATVLGTNISCFQGADGKITLSSPTGGSGDYQYSLDGISWQSSLSFTGLTAGTYSVYIRDAAQVSCYLNIKEVQLTQPTAALATTVTTTRTTSFGTSTGTAVATPTGGTTGYFYEWRKAGEATILKTTQSINNLPAGNYELTVKDSKGCSVVHPFKIIDKVKAGITSSSLCYTQHDYLRTSTFQVDLPEIAGGVGSPANFTYTWNFGSDASISTGSGTGEFTITWGNFGDKVVTLTIKDEAGVSAIYSYDHYVGTCFEGCGETENFELNINNFFIGDKDGNKLVGNNCLETAEKYLWIEIIKNANGYSLNAELNYAVNDGAQTYSRKAVGCFEEVIGTSGSKNIYKPVPLGLFRLFRVQETGTEAGKITWKCGETFKVEQILLRWTNQENRGCGEGTKPMCYGPAYPITVNTPLMVTAIPDNVLCKGTNTGTLIIQATGGYLPYKYSITGPKNVAYQDGNEFYNLPAGEYTYSVKDARGIVSSGTATIIEPSTNITATITSVDPLCYGETGQATVIPVGGTPFIDGNGNPYYEYVWNSGQTTSTATELLDGIYSVTVKDANGCEVLETIEIFEPEQLTIAETGEDIIYNCGFRVAELWANTPERGIGTWTITSAENGGVISDPSNPTSSFSGNAGVHTVRWTIANEDGTCESYSEMNVTFSEGCSTLDFDGIDDYVFFDDNYGLTTGSFTIEAWVKPNSLGGLKTVLSKRNSFDLSEGGYDLVINNGSPAFRWGASGSVSTSFKINTDRWYHLAVIFKNNQVKLYVDGINLGTATGTNPKAITHPFLVGAMFKDNKQEKPQNLFNGWIEEVRIWDASLNEEQLRFLMNQRIKLNSAPLRGTVLPVNVPGTIQWTNLLGYYRMIGETVVNGMTLDEADNKADGELRNITTTQQNTAPLPYISAQNSEWGLKATWLRPQVWDFPNSNGINGAPITWNIARTSNNITSGLRDITMLGLLSESNKLTIANPNSPLDENNPGQGLTITHYLRLDGVIDLVGESQLVQTDIDNSTQSITSILEEASSGYIERAQQGTANSYNYNYWSSPVSLQGAANNSTFTIGQVMLDGSSTANYGKTLTFGAWHEFADGGFATPRKISNYWLHKFRGTANVYSEWVHIGSTGTLLAGEGYTMKGTSGNAAIEDRQNYVYRGKPNNGTITLGIGKDQNYLLGNPYPSAIDISEFIKDNLKDVTGGKNTTNVFNGAVYFWDHFAGKSHILKEYIGGYATRNLIGGVSAISSDLRINPTDDEGTKIPGEYIPVAQGFFINTSLDPSYSSTITVDGGDVYFKNSQRKFVRESTGNTGNSIFLSKEPDTKKGAVTAENGRIRLDFISPLKYKRQILVGIDPNTTSDFDLGYDAPLNEYNAEDMYWLIKDREFVIQGVPDFNLERVLPVGIVTDKKGEFTIKVNDLENIADDLKIYLKDNTEGTYTNLRKGDFKIDIDPGMYHLRFEIVFQQIIPIPEGEENEEDLAESPEGQTPGEEITTGGPEVFYLETDMQLVVKNPELEKINKITLHSLSGQIIEEYTGIAPLKEIKLPVRSYSSSVYVVKMFTEKGIIYKKMIINN